jgi:hypothetical protein
MSRYVGQKNVLGHALTATEVKTLHVVEPGVMHYKLRSKGGKTVTRVFKPVATPAVVAELEKKIRKVRKNKGTKRGPRAKVSPIGLAGMKILMRRGRPTKARKVLVTPGSAIGLAGMKIMAGRKTRKNKGVARGHRAGYVTPGSMIGLAGMKILARRGRPAKAHKVLITPGSAIGLAGMKIMAGRKTRSDKGKKRGSRTRKVRSVPTGGARKVRVARRKVRSLPAMLGL